MTNNESADSDGISDDEIDKILEEMEDDPPKRESFRRPVPADYEPEEHEHMHKGENGGYFVSGLEVPTTDRKSTGTSKAEKFFEATDQQSTETEDPTEFYERWMCLNDDSGQEVKSSDGTSPSRSEEPEDEEDRSSTEKDETSAEKTTPADRIERIARSTETPGLGGMTKRNASNTRRQAIDDDRESPTSPEYISPARTQFDPTTDANGNQLPAAKQEKFERLRKHQDERVSGYNDTENAITKVRECDRIAAALDLNEHQRRVLKDVVFEIDMDNFGSFSTSQVALFAAFAVLRTEYKRHHLSYKPSDEQYPDEIDAAEILNLGNHKDDFEELRQAENKAAAANAPTITKSTLKDQAKKIEDQGLLPNPEYRYEL